MRKIKKSQISSAFNYITAAIIIGVILIFGTVSIIKLINHVNKIDDQTFRKDFKMAIDRAGSSLHSVQYIELGGLKKFDKVCFFDSNQINRNELANDNEEYIIKEFPSLSGALMETTDTVFLFGDKTIEDNFEILKIAINKEEYPNGYVCANVTKKGTINLKLEGLGKTVSVGIPD